MDCMQWVDSNFEVIAGWASKNFLSGSKPDELRKDAYIAATTAADICIQKQCLSQQSFRTTFYNLLKQRLLAA